MINKVSYSQKILISFFIITISIFFDSDFSHAQSIRKNYRELTSQEKINYVNALNALYTAGITEDYVTDHLPPSSGGFAQHSNDNFLPWHRMYLYYFEQELIAQNPKVNLAYWDWTYSGDWSSSSPIFSTGLFGQSLNSTWASNISRPFGSSNSQPTSGTLSTEVAYTNYTTFSGALEANPHGMAHCWIGGTMCNINISPRDPVFYSHHAMIDKVFQDWSNTTWAGGTISTLSTNLGTVTGQSNINCNSIIDSRALKIWYAYNGAVTLDKYTVSSTTLGVSTGDENYYYTGTINFAGDDTHYFTVPSAKTCNSVSATEIVINPGFIANSGSVFTASIDANRFNTSREGVAEVIQNKLNRGSSNTENLLKIYPNPSTGNFNVLLPENTDSYEYEINDVLGNSVTGKSSQTDQLFSIDLSNKSSGIYIMKFKLKNGDVITKILSKQ